MRRRLILSIVLFLGVVGSIFTFDLFSDRTPVLGLDLRGGLSVIYAPEASVADQVTEADLEFIRDKMRTQLEDFGIAEPDVRVEGGNIVADLPGVNDQESAFDALKVSGIVELRPVLQCFVDPTQLDPTVTGETVPGSTPQGSTPAGSTPAGTTPAGSTPAGTTPAGTSPVTSTPTLDTVPGTTAPGGTSPATTGPATTGPASTVGIVEEQGLGYFGNAVPIGAAAPVGTTSPGTTPAATTPGTTPDATTPGTTPGATTPGTTPGGTTPGTTPTGSTPDVTTPGDGSIDITTDGSVPIDITSDDLSIDPTLQTPEGADSILPYAKLGQQCSVGPPGGSGEVFEQRSASSSVDAEGGGGWRVTVDLTAGGQTQWNSLATQCYNAVDTCPTRQLAIILDNEIITAPTVQVPSFDRNVQITGMADKEEADNLADVLNRGAFPVQVEPQRTETVSPSAGQDSLNAAIIAGLIGVAVMLFSMILYYRRLALIMIVGLLIWGVTVFTLATLVSRATNFALTLAGATGIIIAVGVTVDTYVVFFERLRDEMRAGRSLANAAPRGYRATGRTVLSADVVSLLASIVLFALSVGSVRGFALYLGLTTVCDLLVFYFFTRPAVLLAGMSAWGRQRSGSRAKPAGVVS